MPYKRLFLERGTLSLQAFRIFFTVRKMERTKGTKQIQGGGSGEGFKDPKHVVEEGVTRSEGFRRTQSV